jgi:hypothetical protein
MESIAAIKKFNGTGPQGLNSNEYVIAVFQFFNTGGQTKSSMVD